eukprot:SAG25_NODE_222_length_11605_cov_6.982357_5_plen_54_part_00
MHANAESCSWLVFSYRQMPSPDVKIQLKDTVQGVLYGTVPLEHDILYLRSLDI